MKFYDLISAIDALSDEDIDDIVDWQMTASPAAKQQHGEPQARQRGYGIGLLPTSFENPLQRMTDTLEAMLAYIQEWPQRG